jgi:hypothetical protein
MFSPIAVAVEFVGQKAAKIGKANEQGEKEGGSAQIYANQCARYPIAKLGAFKNYCRKILM